MAQLIEDPLGDYVLIEYGDTVTEVLRVLQTGKGTNVNGKWRIQERPDISPYCADEARIELICQCLSVPDNRPVKIDSTADPSLSQAARAAWEAPASIGPNGVH